MSLSPQGQPGGAEEDSFGGQSEAGGNELTVDLSEPSITVAVSFLLGTIPRPLWNFIEDTAERFAGRLG